MAVAIVVMLFITGAATWWVVRQPGVSGGKQIFGPNVSWMLLVGAIPGDERAVTVSLSARDGEGRPITSPAPPIAVLRMVDEASLPERVDLVEAGPGSWRGAARLSTPGRWKLDLELDGETVSLPFESRPR